ncbi:MAG: apolipoprotein N-acyltransferase [Treponema sp.]|jgi:apolipoprotein N-acyltransferase|nr:apolipoprotein N-acyltransferase [Treponema sp.]
MINTLKGNGPKQFGIHLGLTILAALLFAGAFPNLLVENGIPLLAWAAYIPVFILIRQVNLAASIFWGALYGYAAYGLFNYWLSVFHPLAGLIVGCIYLVYVAILFFFLKLAGILFPKRAYLVQWIIWIGYEYLRTQGFLGYSYGITGYSQWRQVPLIQIAGIFGVWGVSALVVFPSAWLGAAWGNLTSSTIAEKRTLWRLALFVTEMGRAALDFFRRETIAACVWLAALIAALVFGLVSPRDFSAYPSVNIALIQHNTDPWKGGIDEYRRNYEILRRLSSEALAAEPRPGLVVWPETAFVPRIYWHETYRDDPASWALIRELLDYLAAQDVPFVIGNDDARKDPAKNPNAREDYRVDYNAVMLYEKGKNTGLYRKLHLVPFTEHFPYRKQFPAIYQALVNADTHFWEKGTEATVFSGPGFKFSTPVCFEDTFGYLSRDFVRNGAELIVNLSNDAWSRSLPAQNQHLAMAVFRAVENQRSMVRSTASGQTCGITPDGKIIALAPPFREAWITVAIPVVAGNTVYTRYGDFLGIGCAAASGFLLIAGAALCIIKRKKERK